MGVGPIEIEALRLSGLDRLFEINKNDFFAVVGLLYFAAIHDPDSGAVLNGSKGFAAFCEIVTQYLLAAPSVRVYCVTDEKGRYVNFFGKAIMAQVGPKVTLQELYASDGSKKHSYVWNLVNDFARYVAVQFFHNGLRGFDSTAALASIQQLLDGKRGLNSLSGFF